MAKQPSYNNKKGNTRKKNIRNLKPQRRKTAKE